MAAVLALWRAIEARDEDARLLVPVLAAMTTALLLIFGAEFFYVTDVFGSRLNTVFKFYYQAWLLLGVSGAAGAWWLYEELKANAAPSLRLYRGAWVGVAALLVAGALLYPLGATLSRTEGLAKPNRTLNGLQYVYDTSSSDEMALVVWLQRNADPGDRLVEAIGGQYSECRPALGPDGCADGAGLGRARAPVGPQQRGVGRTRGRRRRRLSHDFARRRALDPATI